MLNLRVMLEPGIRMNRLPGRFRDAFGPYTGMCHGGESPHYSPEQTAAISAQNQLVSTMTPLMQEEAGRRRQAFTAAFPYMTSRVAGGDPNTAAYADYAGGTNAQAYAPARARVLRYLDAPGRMYGAGPSGSKAQTIADFEATRARDFDSKLSGILANNEKAKQDAAKMLMGQQTISNPVPYGQVAGNANASIINSSYADPGSPGFDFGGLLGAGMSFI